jgi:hypothetical protein
MKNLGSFRSWDATLALVLIAAACQPALAQDATGNKPETMEMHGAPARAKVRSTALTVAFGDKTLTLTPADLAALPHETVTVINGHTKASETYTGVPIAALLDKLGLAFTRPNEHTLLRTYLVAEGTDGYRVLVSTYETLAPIRGQSAIIADTLNGQPLATDGAFKLVIPGDTRPQRWVQNLKAVTFKTIE